MDEEDFALIERDLAELAEMLGAPDAVDDQLFRRRNFETGIERAMPDRERVVEKILALERVAALLDRRTFETAMQTIQTVADRGDQDSPFERGPAPLPESAAVLADDGESIAIAFSSLPDLREIRSLLLRLANDIAEGA
jgi:hypothetical protein